MHEAHLAGCAERMAAAFRAGGRLFTFGNGGSSTDAQDVAALFLNPGGDARPLPALALTTDVAVVTALSNDIGFEVVFARQLGAFGRPGDIALGLSTSGNSANLIRAFEEAARRRMLTIGLAGQTGGLLAELDRLDHLFAVPSSSVHRARRPRPPSTTPSGSSPSTRSEDGGPRHVVDGHADTAIGEPGDMRPRPPALARRAGPAGFRASLWGVTVSDVSVVAGHRHDGGVTVPDRGSGREPSPVRQPRETRRTGSRRASRRAVRDVRRADRRASTATS